jgi:hypothetical protein
VKYQHRHDQCILLEHHSRNLTFAYVLVWCSSHHIDAFEPEFKTHREYSLYELNDGLLLYADRSDFDGLALWNFVDYVPENDIKYSTKAPYRQVISDDPT